MLKLTFALMAITIAVLGESSLANQAMDHPLQEKVAKSDIVFLGTVQQLDYVMPAGKKVVGRTALIRVDTPLKGNPKGEVLLAYGTEVWELEPECCDMARVYLFFLRRLPDGRYTTASGRFGIYRVKGMSPTFPWQMTE